MLAVDLQEDMAKTFAKGTMLEESKIPGISKLNDFLDYTNFVVNSVNAFEAIRSIDNVFYLKAYKRLLDALDTSDEASIVAEEWSCAMCKLDMTAGGDIEEMERYATYLYLIEKSLPKDYAF